MTAEATQHTRRGTKGEEEEGEERGEQLDWQQEQEQETQIWSGAGLVGEQEAMGADLEKRRIPIPGFLCNVCNTSGVACAHYVEQQENHDNNEEEAEAEGMEIDQGKADKKLTPHEIEHVITPQIKKVLANDVDMTPAETKEAQTQRESFVELKMEAQQAKKELDNGECGYKLEGSSSQANSAAGITTLEEQSVKVKVPSEDQVPRPRRSDSLRSGGLRKPFSTKTRSSSLSSQELEKSPNMEMLTPASPEFHGNHGVKQTRRQQGENGEELRQSSSSEELNGDGDGHVDEVMEGTGYRCKVCSKDFESAKSLSQHKKFHYELRRNPKRSRKFIDQDYTLEAGVIDPAQGATVAAPTKKTSSMSDEFPRPCSECGKAFSSWKALFGHMRCHPEREWRGIQPPAEKNCSTSGLGPGQSVIGGSHMSSRRKKVRPPPSAPLPPPPAPPVAPAIPRHEDMDSMSTESRKAAPEGPGKALDYESDTDSIEAAYMNADRQSHMIYWTKRSKRSRQTHRSLDAVNSSKSEQLNCAGTPPTETSVQSDMIDALMLLQAESKKKERRALATPDSEPKGLGIITDRQVDSDPEEIPSREVNTHRRKQKMEVDHASLCDDTDEGGDELEAGEQGSSARSKYECATCKKIFKSHQALGGHRASHKKVKGCYARTTVNEGSGGAPEDSPDTDVGDAEELLVKLEEQVPTSRELQDMSNDSEEEVEKSSYLTAARDDKEEMLHGTARKSKSHMCSICQRVFASGQALGGHKRCHWGGGGGGGGSTTSGAPEATTSSSTKPMTITSSSQGGVGVQQQEMMSQQSRSVKEKVLDLNLPPAPESLEEMAQEEAEIYMPGLAPSSIGPAQFFFNPTSRNPYAEGQHASYLTSVPGLTPTSA